MFRLLGLVCEHANGYGKKRIDNVNEPYLVVDSPCGYLRHSGWAANRRVERSVTAGGSIVVAACAMARDDTGNVSGSATNRTRLRGGGNVGGYIKIVLVVMMA